MIINPIIPLIIFIPITIIILLLMYKTHNINICNIILLILIFAINIRPMIIDDEEHVLKNNLDILFVIDNSISMIANDYNSTTRLDGAKETLEKIIKELNGAKFSIMTFHSKSKILIPFMSDANTAIDTIQDINVQEYWYARGTTLNTPYEDIIKSLKSASKNTDRRRILFFISDGEITNDEALKSFEGIKEYITDGAVLGFGTTKGAKMLLKDKYTNESSYLYDYDTHADAISKMDEDNLKKIAKDIDIDYIHITNENDINSKIDDIKDILEKEMTDENKINYTDIYYLFCIPLFCLILYIFYTYRRNLI